jgi:hypothetical protein
MQGGGAGYVVSPVPHREEHKTGSRPRLLVVFPLAALVILAFAVRLIGITLVITPDEDNWMRRTGNFAEAMRQGDYRRTFQSGHPGVTTMWVARIGAGPDVAKLAGVTVQDHPVTREPGFMEFLVRARLAMIAVNAALLGIIVVLTRRLAGSGPALVGGIILALDPFFVAHTQVVHLDGLSAGLMTVSILAAGVFWWAGGARGYLVLCGVAAGLAVLTKAPSLVLGLLVPIVALSAPLARRGAWSLPRLLVTLIAGGLLGVVVVVALWPTFWVAPIESVTRAIRFTLDTSAEHRPGNFFMGQAVADPGPWYYPIAMLFRISPLALAGLVALGVLLPPPALRKPTYLLLLFVVGFILFLSLAGKKLDRYTLPAFPALDVLAGVGLWTLWGWIRPLLRQIGLPESARQMAGALALAIVLIGQALPLWMVAPYPLAYYNPLLGGGPAAVRVLLVGWGEGLDQVATYLNAQPNAEQQMIAVYFPLELNFHGMVAGTVTQYGDARPVDYVVDYINAAQREQTPSEVTGLRPAYEVWINGIRYARVFKLDPPRRVRQPQ